MDSILLFVLRTYRRLPPFAKTIVYPRWILPYARRIKRLAVCERPPQPRDIVEEEFLPDAYESGRVLLMGHFSTIGDLEVLAVTRSWLDEAGMHYDFSPFEEAYRSVLPGSVDWRTIASRYYSAVVFVCGPMVLPQSLPRFFSRFSHCSIYGLNLSIGPWLGGFSPFARLWPRDDGTKTHPDLSLLHTETKVPVVGVCLIHPQAEYADNQCHALVCSLIDDFLSANDFAVIRLDTEALASRNICGLCSVDAITTLLGCCDVVITTRLHGTVLSLKQGVPVLAIDSISGGAKVLAQAKILGWPHVVTADELSLNWLQTHFHECLSENSQRLARECVATGIDAISQMKEDFQATLKQHVVVEHAAV